MVEFLKDIALTIMAVGFGLAVLLPALVNMFVATGFAALIKPSGWKEILSKYGIFLLTIISAIAFGAYFAVTLYYIWIK